MLSRNKLIISGGVLSLLLNIYFVFAILFQDSSEENIPKGINYSQTSSYNKQVATEYPRKKDTSFTLLHQLIVSEYPEFGIKNISDWKKVNILRQWVAEHADEGIDVSIMLDQDKEFNFYTKSVPDIFAAFFNDKGSVWCGGMADILKRLYEDYGFESFTVNVGEEKKLITHMFSIVSINFDNRNIFVVQDPYLDLTYVNSKGEPYDYFELQKTLREGRRNLVKIQEGPSLNRDFLVPPDKVDFVKNFWLFRDIKDPQPVLRSEGGLYKYKVKPDINFFLEATPSLQEFLIRKGHTPDAIYLLLYPFAIYGDAKESKLLLEKAPGSNLSSFEFKQLLYDYKGIDLINALEKNFYGNHGVKEALAVENDGILFKPTSKKDHLATSYVSVVSENQNDIKLLKISLFFQPSKKPGKNCYFQIQDEQFNEIDGFHCVSNADNPQPEETFVRNVKIKPAVSKIRLVIYSTDGKRTYLPNSIKIEQYE